MNKELIEKLKDPKQAQPFCLRSEEERVILTKADPSNCLLMSGVNKWTPSRNHASLSTTDTYILKPDYEPEPEYEDIEVVADVEGALRLSHAISGKFGQLRIDIISSRKDFVGFFYDINSTHDHCGTASRVAREIREGHKVYARFVKD